MCHWTLNRNFFLQILRSIEEEGGEGWVIPCDVATKWVVSCPNISTFREQRIIPCDVATKWAQKWWWCGWWLWFCFPSAVTSYDCEQITKSNFLILFTFPREAILAMAKKVTISYSLSKCLTSNLLYMKLKCKLYIGVKLILKCKLMWIEM